MISNVCTYVCVVTSTQKLIFDVEILYVQCERLKVLQTFVEKFGCLLCMSSLNFQCMHTSQKHTGADRTRLITESVKRIPY